MTETRTPVTAFKGIHEITGRKMTPEEADAELEWLLSGAWLMMPRTHTKESGE